MTSFLTPLALALVATVCTAQMYLTTTGPNTRRIRKLSNTSINTVCPDDFPTGLSLECATTIPGTASFFVKNELVRIERVKPFFIAGDAQGKASPWTNYPMKGRVSCRPNGWYANSITVGLEFKCPRSPSPSSTSSPSPSPSPSQEMSKPPTAGNEPPAPKPMPDTSDCIIIDTRTDFTSPLPNAWTIDDDEEGITFRKGDNRTNITPKGKFPIYYPVVATSSSRFAIVIDMTTRHRTEHNDVWVEFAPVGIQGRLKDSVENFTGWVKAYHGEVGRSLFTSTVDFRPHRLSTGEALEKGTEYTMGFSGRSSLVTVHQVIMFPCSDDGCKVSPFWNRNLDRCLTF